MKYDIHVTATYCPKYSVNCRFDGRWNAEGEEECFRELKRIVDDYIDHICEEKKKAVICPVCGITMRVIEKGPFRSLNGGFQVSAVCERCTARFGPFKSRQELATRIGMLRHNAAGSQEVSG